MPPRWFKRSYRGLYEGRSIQFGNKVSFAENKTRRTWKPNVQKTTLYSQVLGETFKTRLTTHAMRCIRKAGGLDQYLLNTSNARIKYPRAIALKRRIVQASKHPSQPTAEPVSGVFTSVPRPTPAQSPNRGLPDVLPTAP